VMAVNEKKLKKKKAPSKKNNIRPKKKSNPTERKISAAAATPRNDQAAILKIPNGNFPIVGIGASAGGLEAFEQFFTHMPSDAGIAFVLIPHLHGGDVMIERLRVTNKTVPIFSKQP
jgi:chemotaxis response regulator CheB